MQFFVSVACEGRKSQYRHLDGGDKSRGGSGTKKQGRVHDTRRYGCDSCVSGQPQALGKDACEGYGQTCCISKGYGAGMHGYECGI